MTSSKEENNQMLLSPDGSGQMGSCCSSLDLRDTSQLLPLGLCAEPWALEADSDPGQTLWPEDQIRQMWTLGLLPGSDMNCVHHILLAKERLWSRYNSNLDLRSRKMSH